MNIAVEAPCPVDGVMRVVLWFDPEKGYGFVEADSGESAFVHHRNIKMGGYRNHKE